MRITCAFTDDGDQDECPTLLSAYDEYTFGVWNGVPDFHAELVAKADCEVRELIIEVPESAVRALFETPAPIQATVVEQ